MEFTKLIHPTTTKRNKIWINAQAHRITCLSSKRKKCRHFIQIMKDKTTGRIAASTTPKTTTLFWFYRRGWKHYLWITAPMPSHRERPLAPSRRTIFQKALLFLTICKGLPIHTPPRHWPPPLPVDLPILHPRTNFRHPATTPAVRRRDLVLKLRSEVLVGEIVEADLREPRPPRLVHELAPWSWDLARLRRWRREPRWATAKASRAAAGSRGRRVLAGTANGGALGGRAEGCRRHWWSLEWIPVQTSNFF